VRERAEGGGGERKR